MENHHEQPNLYQNKSILKQETPTGQMLLRSQH